jgi:hypothetical protein
MTIAIIGIVFNLFLANLCFGQTYWKRTYGGLDCLEDIKPTVDGNFLIAGYKLPSGKDFFDGWLIKIKPNGDTIWTRTYGGAEGYAFLKIQPTSDGNFFIVGYKYYNRDGPDYLDGWLVKIKPNGDTIWTKTFGGFNDDCFYAIQPTSDGNFLIVGYKGGNKDGAECIDGWLVKINPDGDTIWMKTYGGEGDSRFAAIQPSGDGNFLLAGYYSIGGSWLVKINPEGDTIWTRTYDRAEGDGFLKIQPTSDGNFLIIGAKSVYGWLVKIRPNGDTIWTKTYSGWGYYNFNAIQSTRDGNFLIVGITLTDTIRWHDGLLIKINSNGDTIWTKTYGGAEYDDFWTIQPTSEGNFLIGGNTGSYRSGNNSIWILCLIADQYAYKNSLFTFKIPTYDVDSLNCGYSPITVPSGMTVSTGGTVSWTPKTDSVYMDHAEFLVIYDAGRKDTLSFNIFVNFDYHAPVLKKPARINTTSFKPFEIITTSLSGKVKFSLPFSASSLYIYDITGRMVDRIVPVISGSGTCAVWPGSASNSSKIHAGKYFAKATGGKNSAVEPFLLVR